jgi:spore coat polysaccharide biosynthesis protein SpsF
MSAALRILVQARTSSRRFPGKVFAPLAGRPMIDHVLARCAQPFGAQQVVVATSSDPSDDALALHVASEGYTVFRGDLDDVFARFQRCLDTHPCDWFVRVSGDSPVIDPGLIASIAERRAEGFDLVCNVQKRTFPSGQSVEVVRTATFAGIDGATLAADEREHVTTVLYRRPGFRILNIASRDAHLGREHLSVDTPEDLRAIEALITAGRVPTFGDRLAA